MSYKYTFQNHAGNKIELTVDKKLTAKLRKQYMECLPGVSAYKRETVEKRDA